MARSDVGRLTAIAKRLESASDNTPRRKAGGRRKKELDANPEVGERGEFLKRTIMLSPDLNTLLLDEVSRRHRENIRPATVTGIIREALVDWFRNNPPA